MKRHPFNVFSLVVGVMLILLAGWVAFPTGDWLFDRPRWLLPAAVILLGAGLMAPLFTGRAGDQQPSGTGLPEEQTDTAPSEPVTRGHSDTGEEMGPEAGEPPGFRP